MTPMLRYFTCCAMLCALAFAVSAPPAHGGEVHNLSTPDSSSTQGPCRYCHVTHHSVGGFAKWDTGMGDVVYQVYSSTTLDATIQQPTGSTKLCLSCHDGVITSRLANWTGPDIPPASQALLQGGLSLGTDLSDDHPVSFLYDSSLSSSDQQLRHPSLLGGGPLKLDENQEVQCVTCHDPHANGTGGLLVMDNQGSALCISCHQRTGWNASIHSTSSAALPAIFGTGTVSDRGCGNCHTPHNAGSRSWLLYFEQEEENCLLCHDGSVALKNIESEINQNSAHDPKRYRNVHDPTENPANAPLHVECQDCHNPHSVKTGNGSTLPGSLEGVSGVNSSGTQVTVASKEYEICFKCHGSNPNRTTTSISRQIAQTNTLLEFNPANPSFHPVVSQGVSNSVPSLIEPMNENTVITCTGCHRSNSSSVRGPHGSSFKNLLVRNYTTTDYTNESQHAYSLCYGCHDRQSILNDESFHEHKKHIEEEDTPCSACHDSHGVSYTQGPANQHSHLINFDLAIVRESSSSGLLRFVDKGDRRGACDLECHGEDHNDEDYNP